MSILLMAEVWRRECEHPEQSVLLALADHAEDDGTNVYPSVAYTAWKTNYSPRQVRRILGGLRERDVLTVMAEASRHRPTEYRIDLQKLPLKKPFRAANADERLPQIREDKMSALGSDGAVEGGHPDRLGVTSATPRADIAVSAEPSVEPPEETKKDFAEKNGDQERWQRTLERLKAEVPASTFDHWLSRLDLVDRRGDVLVLQAPDQVAEWVRQRFIAMIEGAAAHEFGVAVTVEVPESETDRMRRELEERGRAERAARKQRRRSA